MADEQSLSGGIVPGSPLKAEISFDSSAFSPSTTPQTRGSELSPGSSIGGQNDHGGAPSAHKKPRTTAVWNHFTERTSISDTHWEIKCLQCKTTYRIKKDGSTGTSTLHKHQKQCSGRLGGAKDGLSPTPRQHHHTPTPTPELRSHEFAAQAASATPHHHSHHHQHQHDGSANTSPSSHASTSHQQQQSLVPNYSAQALQDFLRAAHQNTEQHGGHAASSLGPNDFDMAATAAAAAASMANAYGTADTHQQQQPPQQHHHQHNLHNQQQHTSQQHQHQPNTQNGGHLTQVLDILVLNPNSSDSITMNLRQLLEPNRPPGVKYTYMTGPPSAPPSINDPPTSILSAQTCFEMLAAQDIPSTKSAILVCCFSAHPLVPMLRHQWPSVPVMHILDTSINHAMSCGANTFGIITTGKAMIADIDAGVRSYIGGVTDRYKGCIATGLGVLELGDLSMRAEVERVIKEESGNLAVERGAEAIILGCAGMAGMEALVKQGVIEAGGSPDKIWVIDGAKAGVQILNGIARCRYADM